MAPNETDAGTRSNAFPDLKVDEVMQAVAPTVENGSRLLARTGLVYVATHVQVRPVVRRDADGHMDDTGKRRHSMTMVREERKVRGKKRRKALKRERQQARRLPVTEALPIAA